GGRRRRQPWPRGRAAFPPPPAPVDRAEKPAAMDKPAAMGMVEGPLKNVDAAAGTVQVSTGPFGLLWRTLAVNRDTRIQVEGHEGGLADLREGSRVKAAYETRDGRNVATEIDVVPPTADQHKNPSSSLGQKQYA